MLILHNLIEKEGDLYSAVCLELNVASQGKTEEEAIESLKEAVDLYLETVFELGEEDKFIPRPADSECWLRYFELEARRLKEEIRKNLSSVIQFENRIHA
jgi:predicted RNase H-like HicB family nuclease